MVWVREQCSHSDSSVTAIEISGECHLPMLWWSQIRNPGISRGRASTHVRTQWRPWQAQDSGVATLVGHAAPRYRPPRVRAVGRRRSSGEEVGGGEMVVRAGDGGKRVAIGTTPNPQRSRTPSFLFQPPPPQRRAASHPRAHYHIFPFYILFRTALLLIAVPFLTPTLLLRLPLPSMILVFHSRKKRCFASRSLYRGAEIKELAVVFDEGFRPRLFFIIWPYLIFFNHKWLGYFFFFLSYPASIY